MYGRTLVLERMDDMIIAFALSMALAAAPQAQSATVPRISAGFENNYERNVFFDHRRQRLEAERQAVIDRRMALADQLDRLIGSGNCPRAQEIALRYGYSDIVEQVDTACEARGLNTGRDAQEN